MIKLFITCFIETVLLSLSIQKYIIQTSDPVTDMISVTSLELPRTLYYLPFNRISHKVKYVKK